ncbi:MAG: hypothetical protein R3B40_22560 [Polyangiales bacterium]|nr:hypothetical protein [Sandaracinaceae bacterium]
MKNTTPPPPRAAFGNIHPVGPITFEGPLDALAFGLAIMLEAERMRAAGADLFDTDKVTCDVFPLRGPEELAEAEGMALAVIDRLSLAGLVAPTSSADPAFVELVKRLRLAWLPLPPTVGCAEALAREPRESGR